MFSSNYKVLKTVKSVKDYKEAIEAAETLGLELADVGARGYGWEAKDGQPVHPGASGGGVDIERVGRKYIYMNLTGPDGVETVGVAFGRSGTDSLDDAELTLRFR